MDFNVALAVNALPLLLEGAVVTVKITAISVSLGILIGLVVGIARIAKFWLVRMLAAVYVDFLINSPGAFTMFLASLDFSYFLHIFQY